MTDAVENPAEHAATDAEAGGSELVGSALVEEVSIDGMCGVY